MHRQGKSWCCAVKSRERARRYYIEHREERKEYQRSRYEADPETHRARVRRHYLANPERKREYNRRYYQANREEILSHMAAHTVYFHVGGIRWSKTVDNKAEVIAARDAFRARQREAYRQEVANGWVD